jgi:two-component system invasion response regulator UvrY
VVMDLSMPGMGGMEAARRMIARYPETKILIFSMHENIAFASQALKAGVKGYVTKTGVSSDLVKAIQEVSEGKPYLSADIAQKIAVQGLMGNDEPIYQLSAREFEIFRMIAEGEAIEIIAGRLKISQKTVANNLTMIKQKLNVTTPIEMLRLAIRHHLLA